MVISSPFFLPPSSTSSTLIIGEEEDKGLFFERKDVMYQNDVLLGSQGFNWTATGLKGVGHFDADKAVVGGSRY